MPTLIGKMGMRPVKEVVKFAFGNMPLAEITLGVFDFNTPAIDVYKSIGFTEFQFKEGARQFQNESLNVIRMKLNKDSWLYMNNANLARVLLHQPPGE